jgi:hypothetical protein
MERNLIHAHKSKFDKESIWLFKSKSKWNQVFWQSMQKQTAVMEISYEDTSFNL